MDWPVHRNVYRKQKPSTVTNQNGMQTIPKQYQCLAIS